MVHFSSGLQKAQGVDTSSGEQVPVCMYGGNGVHPKETGGVYGNRDHEKVVRTSERKMKIGGKERRR